MSRRKEKKQRATPIDEYFGSPEPRATHTHTPKWQSIEIAESETIHLMIKTKTFTHYT